MLLWENKHTDITFLTYLDVLFLSIKKILTDLLDIPNNSLTASECIKIHEPFSGPSIVALLK